MHAACRLISLLLFIHAAVSVAAAEPAAGAPANHVLDRVDVESWLDGFMPYALQTGDVAGAVVVVVKDGAPLLAKGYGYSDVATQAPVNPDLTLFRPGSVSKLFTWTAVMQLVEQGRLDLDRNVSEYLDFPIPDRGDGPITLRNIMTHTAGFEEQVRELILDDAKSLPPLKTYLTREMPLRLYKSGSTPAYSNYATTLAGYIVQRVSGQPFDEYIETHIFKPLGMDHSTFRQPLPPGFEPNMSKGYEVASQPPKPYEIVVPAPAGSLASSGSDMARFMIAHLEGGTYGDAHILSPQTAKLMHETPLPMIPPLNRMLLGFYEQNYNGHRVISHGGDTNFFHSDLNLFLDDHVGLFISMNSVGREGAAHVIRETLFEEFANRYFPGPAQTGKVDTQTAANDARVIAGYYENSRRIETSFLSLANLISPTRVVINDDGTVGFSPFHTRGGGATHYKEVQPFVWLDQENGRRLAAKVVDGQVVRLSADEISPFMVFEHTPWYRSPAWLLPVGGAALIACLLTALLWPVAALTRRRHRVALGLSGLELRGHVYSRAACVAIAAVTIGWAALIATAFSDLALLGPGFDPWLFLMHTLSVIAYVGGAVVLVWSAFVAWTTHRRWAARLWTTVLALSGVVILWTACVYPLMNFRANY